MINSSDAYRNAVSADTRRTVVKVETDVVNPDVRYLDVTATTKADISVDKQLYNGHDEITRYATLERNFWALDGGADIFTDDYSRQQASDKIGFVGDTFSGADGSFQTPFVLNLSINHPGRLQAASVYFSEDAVNGYPKDFTVSIYVNDILVYSWNVTDNTGYSSESPELFEAFNPTKIVLTVTKWSLAGRRVRLLQMIPGVHLVWSGDEIASLNVEQNTDPSCVTLPYSTAKLSIDNSGKVFEPRNKEGFFRSIQARQIVEIYIGLLVGEEYEYRSIGKFYQHSGGWSSSDNGLSIEWDLVDIVGLLSDKEYALLKTPTTLEEWARSFVSQLGENFADRYLVDEEYADSPVVPPHRRVVRDKSTGELIRYAGLATGTWARADAKTGYLTFEPLWEQGVKMTLHNMNTYPTMSENDDIGTITITKPEIIDEDTGKVTEEEKTVFGGTNLAASHNISIESPFIIDDNDVQNIFRQVITQYGGNAYDVTWRGDPCAECGDVVTLELDERHGTSARLVEQSFDYSSGVLANCKAKLIQPQGYWTYANGKTFTENTVWEIPEDVYSLFLIVVGGGRAGDDGDDGNFAQDGLDGWDGEGGKVYAGEISVYPGQSFNIVIGSGSSKYAIDPEPSAFGSYSSNDGKYYQPSYTDIRSGSAFARWAAKNPLPNTGDGGKGGKGGEQGKMHTGKSKDDFGFVTEITVVDKKPGKGEKGSPGASGCVVVYWN